MIHSDVRVGQTYRVRRAHGTVTVRITAKNEGGSFNAVDVQTNEETYIRHASSLMPIEGQTETAQETTPVAPPETTTPETAPAPTEAAAAPSAAPQRFSPKCMNAMREFKKAKPWRGNIDERKAKFSAVHEGLCAAYGLSQTLVYADDIDPLAPAGASGCEVTTEAITLHNKLSVVTYLFGIGLARAFCPVDALKWANALYKRVFPISAARHQVNGYGLVVPIA